jgi:glycosyltransferase involved in cell wall biosynthesis
MEGQRKKILIVSSQRPYYGGASTTAYNLTKLLGEKFEVKSVFIFRNQIEDYDPDNIGNIYGVSIYKNKYINKIVSLFLSHKNRDFLFFSLLIQIKYLFNKIKFRPDLVIVNIPVYFKVVQRIFKSKKILFIVNGHSYLDKYWDKETDVNKLIENELCKTKQLNLNIDLFPPKINGSVIFNSVITQNVYNAFGHYLGNSSISFFNMLRVPEFKIKNFNERKYDIAFVISKFSRKVKNPELALEIFNQFPSHKKIAIGEGSSEFENCPNTLVMPLMHQADIYKILNNTKVVLITSYYDSSPGLQAEAILMGANIVSSKNIGWSETLDLNSVVTDYFNIGEWVEKTKFSLDKYHRNLNFKNIVNNSKKNILNEISILVNDKSLNELKKKVYIGFSVDMDRAYSGYDTYGNLISKSHEKYLEFQNYAIDFVNKTHKLIEYFYKKNSSNSVTWFVNEADFNISKYYPDLLNNCIHFGGELGLHTHFNSKRFSDSLNTMSENSIDWEEFGIIEPTRRLEEFKADKIVLFKSGNHLRNDNMFSSLTRLGYRVDVTMGIDRNLIIDGISFGDDRGIKIGDEPFFIKTNNGAMLEIPESNTGKALLHARECAKNNKLCFIKLQIHHWQFDELTPEFDKFIDRLKFEGFDVEFVSLMEMQKIYFKKIMLETESFIFQRLKTELKNDSYYNSLKGVFHKTFLDVLVFIFNNFKSDIKILELFSGVGQYSYLLTKFNFQNLSIVDFRKDRLSFFEELKSIDSDFFTFDLNSFDLVFATNAINSSLLENVDLQISKYSEFLSIKPNNALIFNYKKYASYDNLISQKIISSLKEKFDVNYLNEEFVVVKNIGVK